jgi:hypothetical protein
LKPFFDFENRDFHRLISSNLEKFIEERIKILKVVNLSRQAIRSNDFNG